MRKKDLLTTTGTLALFALFGSPASTLGPAAGAAQETLGQPVATQAEAFGLISGVRELSDGSVLVADPLGGMLVKLDPSLGGMEKIGREGEGPGEYRQPDGIWPIGGDRSLLVDLGNARLTVVEADGTLGEDTPIVLPSGGGGLGGMMMAIPRGTDDAGNVYFQGSAYGPGGARDTIEVYRVDLAVGEPEIVTMVRAPEMTVQESGGANNQSVSVQQVPMGKADTWGVARDGSIYIARVGDYSVEYVRASGSSRTGDPIDYRPVRIGGDEKQEWDDERARNGGIQISVSVQNGQRRMQMGRSAGDRADLERQPWPDTKPPFTNGRIRIDSAGNGWVRRSMPAGEASFYDVFNTLGEHVKTVSLPDDRILIGFGNGTLYTARIDEFDQQFLEKYDLP
ncbi:MAG: hypothetical protein OEU54_02820 [Gemmatimonadota bacterium]|nr:hypothetical protein [Gemmatimonadota bacterium]